MATNGSPQLGCPPPGSKDGYWCRIGKLGWGQFIITTLTGVAVILTGAYSQALGGASKEMCGPMSTGDAKIKSADIAKSANDAQTAGMVALGVGISILVVALTMKFALFTEPAARGMLLILLAVPCLALGSIVMSQSRTPGGDSDNPEASAAADEQAGYLGYTPSTVVQNNLGAIMVGFGLGLAVPGLIKLLMDLLSKRLNNLNLDPAQKSAYQLGNNRASIAIGIFLLAGFATFAGSWSWSNYNKCKKTEGSIPLTGSTPEAGNANQNAADTAATLNGIGTVVAGVTAAYCLFFAIISKVKPNLASALANFGADVAAAARAAGGAGAAAARQQRAQRANAGAAQAAQMEAP